MKNVNIITTMIAIAFVDKFGRKPLLILVSIGMTVTLGTMAYTFSRACAYGLYTIAAAISLFFVLFFIKETKGVELEQM